MMRYRRMRQPAGIAGTYVIRRIGSSGRGKVRDGSKNSGFGEVDKQICPCRKAMIAVRIAAVMAAGAMVISQI